MTDPSNVDVVRACLESYVAQDRETAEQLIADDFVFTSPQDDHIDRRRSSPAASRRPAASARRRSWPSRRRQAMTSSSCTSTN